MDSQAATRDGGSAVDVAFVGGGLANTLAAYRLRQLRPDLTVCVFERRDALGCDHTWSFHETDVTDGQRAWLDPFLVHRWPSQQVWFPGHCRKIRCGYASVTSERLHSVAAVALGPALRLGGSAVRLTANSVQLESGERIAASCVIDGRGEKPHSSLVLGYQKFLGQELITERPHGVTAPVIMDARVPQTDGYRFMYLLPIGPRQLLVEDTYYSTSIDLDEDRLRATIQCYVENAGWGDIEVLREERGILPIALAGDIDAFWRARVRDAPVAYSGLRAALFHPTTGYSLPDAVRLADELAAQPSLKTAPIAAFITGYSKRVWRDRQFFRLLNRLLFVAAKPRQRRAVMERFYKLPDDLIERFYAGTVTPLDKARILVGKPPISVARALACLSETSVLPRETFSRSGQHL